ncbi:MAG: acylneuraminate cytidylyltransferase family protein [Ruminococcus sp.]|nr:acylneuraminate cytidylyltransferase family protein [Ruminococcus sp.]
MNHIAIIPARSGSKGLKDKNIKELHGKPLLAHSILAARDSGLFSDVMVSTDSAYYARIARECGADVPFLRSEETSNDTAGSWDVVKEVLWEYRKRGKEFQTVCLLQPTSPLRKAEDIVGGYEEMKKKHADAITSVCEVDHSPLWTMTLDSTLSLEEFRKRTTSMPRQMLKTYYRLNGALYIRKVEYGAEEIKILCEKEYAYRMDRNRSVDIDTADDFAFAEYLMEK